MTTSMISETGTITRGEALWERRDELSPDEEYELFNIIRVVHALTSEIGLGVSREEYAAADKFMTKTKQFSAMMAERVSNERASSRKNRPRGLFASCM